MEKLTITAELESPFITGGGYMTFDGIDKLTTQFEINSD